MRRESLSFLAALCLCAGAADAKPPAQPPADPGVSEFWRGVIEPHGREVAVIVQKAQSALNVVDNEQAGDTDAFAEQRMRYFQDAYGMLRYAHRLSPENTDVLKLLGRAADELGKTPQAIEALEAAARLLGPDKAGVDVTGRLGAIYLRLGKLDDAIRWLRVAQGPIGSQPSNAIAAVHLATALALHGQASDAIDMLANSLPTVTGYQQESVTLVMFALAVLYDREDQRSAAFDMLDKLETTYQQELGTNVQRALAMLRFAPAEDQHYYQALLYEVLGDYTEARAEWAFYASILDAPYRARALEHVKAIDAQRKSSPGIRPVPQQGQHHIPPIVPTP